jgi:molecular chaperone IbpA
MHNLESTFPHKFFIGFDSLINDMDMFSRTNTNYPPYDIVQTGEDTYQIRIAVAGFTPDLLDIQMEQNHLTVTGLSPKPSGDAHYFHRGISAKPFARRFVIHEHVKVVNANMENGLLVITLNRVIPDELKPRKIVIATSEPQLLTEQQEAA